MSEAISCPNCLKRFAWTPKVAGKRVTCHCGQKFITPDAPGGDVIPIYETGPAGEADAPKRPRETYDLAGNHTDAGPAAPEKTRSRQHAGATKCPDCNAPVKPDAVVCVRCGFDLSAGQKLRTEVRDDDPGDALGNAASGDDELARRAALAAEPAIPVRTKLEDALAAELARKHRFREFTLPMALLVLGLALLLFNTVFMAPWNDRAAALAYGSRGMGMTARLAAATQQHLLVTVIIVGLTAGGRLLNAVLLGNAFGNPGVATLKILAFALSFLGLSMLTYYSLNIFVAGLFAIVVLFWCAITFGLFTILHYAVWDDSDQTEVGILAVVLTVGFFGITIVIVPIVRDLLGFA